jgi:hypothetical protein
VVLIPYFQQLPLPVAVQAAQRVVMVTMVDLEAAVLMGVVPAALETHHLFLRPKGTMVATAALVLVQISQQVVVVEGQALPEAMRHRIQ